MTFAGMLIQSTCIYAVCGWGCVCGDDECVGKYLRIHFWKLISLLIIEVNMSDALIDSSYYENNKIQSFIQRFVLVAGYFPFFLFLFSFVSMCSHFYLWFIIRMYGVFYIWAFRFIRNNFIQQLCCSTEWRTDTIKICVSGKWRVESLALTLMK